MIRALGSIGLCGAALLVVSGCGGVPGGVIRGPETPLKFTAATEKRTLTEENPAGGLNIPGERKALATTTSPANFTVITAGADPCKLTEDEVLNRGEFCTIGVEFTSGTRGIKANFVQLFGPRGEPERLRAEYGIES